MRNYELDRSQIVLSAKIGVGQFGDVYVGSYTFPVSAKAKTKANDSSLSNSDAKYDVMQVAVKTCKANEDPEKTENFLAEACKFESKLYFKNGASILIGTLFRYNAKVRSSTHYSPDWHLQYYAHLDCYGIGKTR